MSGLTPITKQKKAKHTPRINLTGKNKNQKTDAPQISEKRPSLNLNTIKLHSIGDYPRTILRLGATDSYSTYMVSAILYI